ncbi:UNKNOWN [Stylonychia lemnae]|uniref:Uncharacterized protein n=1 Tax=Stylonychia lemnae TaxID=5949 RepID=A0A078ASC8_STYLE|nr:UNKNOWN [Stylonychia lemnae]|eukprot:CDW83793.1 UNKNOWN [Stylonychia lemnae]
MRILKVYEVDALDYHKYNEDKFKEQDKEMILGKLPDHFEVMQKVSLGLSDFQTISPEIQKQQSIGVQPILESGQDQNNNLSNRTNYLMNQHTQSGLQNQVNLQGNLQQNQSNANQSRYPFQNTLQNAGHQNQYQQQNQQQQQNQPKYQNYNNN